MSKHIFKWKICRILLAACLSTFSLRTLQTDAATITVTNLNDSGPRSLWQVIADSSSGDTIDFMVTFSESFDRGCGTPGLPAGWRSTNVAGPPPPWAKSTTAPASPPCDAYVDDPFTISDKRLDSPSIAIQTPTARLIFLNNYEFDFDPEFPRQKDGGVLEISIGGEPFIDILSSGGSFGLGGYNAMIPFGGGNPLGGRRAWCRTSHGYISTIVNLPARAAGERVRLRWRMGSSSFNNYLRPGWRIDNVKIVERVNG